MSDFQFKDNVLSLSKKNEIIIQKCKCTVGRDVELHSHRFIEIAYIASGSGIHDIGDGYSSKIEKGDLILLNSNVSHGFKSEDVGQLVVYNCIFDPSVLRFAINKSDDFINIVYSCLFDNEKQNSVSKPYIILNDAGAVFPVINEMYTEYTERPNGFEKINEANLIRLLVSIFRLQMSGRENGGGAYRHAIAESAVRYMNDYYNEKITCEMLASRAYLSTGYFHRIFKSVTGEAPIEYLQKLRLQKAADMLTNSSSTVRQTAAAVGYSDMKHFYKIFYKKFGQTPKQYQDRENIE
ncbi:MAG: helix-turn-helix domain-containing protein [Clostridia bacterium]|nr:helix-turn-helix domain-containing protein [Clostridia bacterium]